MLNMQSISGMCMHTQRLCFELHVAFGHGVKHLVMMCCGLPVAGTTSQHLCLGTLTASGPPALREAKILLHPRNSVIPGTWVARQTGAWPLPG